MSKQETAAQLRKVANFLKGLIQAADDIEAIGSMEGATAEAIKARDAAVAERDKALAALADAKAKATAALKVAEGKVEGMLVDAQAKADAKIAEAQALVDKTTHDLIARAERQAAEITAKARSDMNIAAGELNRMGEDKVRLTAEVADLEEKAKAARAEHDKLTKALEKIKAQFKIGE